MNGNGDGDSLVRIVPYVQHYAWGSVSALADFLQVPPTGEPMAEAWFGVHPAGPSTVLVDGLARPLADIVSARRQTMGFLLKVLAIASPLSLQLHPTLEQAGRGFADENARGVALTDPTRVYRDANHKPELICALTELDALCGFRSAGETAGLLSAVGVPLAERMVSLINSGTSLRDVVRRLLTPGDALLGVSDAARVEATAELVAGAEHAVATGCPEPWRLALSWIATLGRTYPGDGGVAVASLLNCVRIQPGEALFLDAGNLHAYLHGLGVEIMANSDNVVRGGLTPKHVAVDELVALVDTDPTPAPLVRSRRSVLEGGALLETWPVPVDDFSLRRVTVTSSTGTPTTGTLTSGKDPTLILCGAGQVRLATDGCTRELPKGAAVYADPGRILHFSGHGACFVTGSGG